MSTKAQSGFLPGIAPGEPGASSPLAAPQSRRDFLRGALVLAASGWTAGCTGRTQRALPAPREWDAASDDPHIVLRTIALRSGRDEVPAYLARPARPGRFPAVVVIHASWLVEPYVADTTAMLAQAGFVGLAVDLFHFFPRVRSWEEARKVPGSLVQEALRTHFREPRMVQNIQTGFGFLKAQPYVAPGGIGLIGFCGGGWNALLVAAQSRDAGSVVVFYAPVANSDVQHRAPLELAPYIQVPVQYHRATRDPHIPEMDVTRFQAALRAQGTPMERYDYDAEHGFFAHDRPVFDPQDAYTAWERSVAFLRKTTGRPTRVRALAPPPSVRGGPADSAESLTVPAAHLSLQTSH